MEEFLNEGILSSLLSGIDPAFRPLAELTLVALIVGAAIAAAIDKIAGFLHRTGILALQLYLYLKKLFHPRPPPPPPPPPGRWIPPEQTIWELRAPDAAISPITNGVPIITAAMKGGVGKTTIAANLAVYFKCVRLRVTDTHLRAGADDASQMTACQP